MKYICCQPNSDYYIWQVQVLLNNLKKWNVEQDAIIIFSFDGEPNKRVFEVFKNSRANFYFFPDERINKSYISSIRPHILKSFFQSVKIFDDVLYIDCDIIFTRKPDLNICENKILVSDCHSYLFSQYITSKGEGLLSEMCEVIGINPNTVISNDSNCGGAQYLIPRKIVQKLDFDFWDKVEKDSTNLFRVMNETAHKYNPQHPIQSWCADMWAILWNFWLSNIETSISKELSFSWATDPISFYNKHLIYHNAGATADRTDLFYKADFISKDPFNADHSNVSAELCSYNYVQEILETAKTIMN